MNVIEFKFKDLGSDMFIRHLDSGGKCRVKVECDCDCCDVFYLICDFVKNGDSYVLLMYFDDGEFVGRHVMSLNDLMNTLCVNFLDLVNDCLELYFYGFLDTQGEFVGGCRYD